MCYIIMMKKFLMIPLLLILSVNVTFAGEKPYTLTEISYDIKGQTKPFFLERKIDIAIGDTFLTINEIDIFEKELLQKLENLRLYEEIKVETEIIDKSVILSIYLDEAWGIIPFGYPKFDSEGGFRAAMKLYWYNSLGTLTDSLLQGGVNVGLDPDEELELQTWDAQYSIDGILLFDKYFDLHYKQSLDRESKGDEEWSFQSSSLSIGTSFNINDSFKYSPSLSATTKYFYKPVNDSVEDKDIIKTPLDVSYSHGFGLRDVNWIGNFRDGYSYYLGNVISLLYTPGEDLLPTSKFTVKGSYYKTFGNSPISLATKLSGVASLNDVEILGLGSNVRGVSSGDLYGTLGVFSNSNLFIRVIKIENLAEAIFAPHFDLGITDKRDLKYGAGADFILYVDKFKSLVARGSLSWDLTKDLKLEDVQIAITSSLFF